MTQRIPLDDMTSDRLDQLHADLDRYEAALARIRALHAEEYGCCSHCTREDAVPYPCATIRALDGQEQPK